MREFHQRLVSELKRYGAEDIRFRPGGKHPKLCWRFKNENYQRVVGATPSDHRALQNDLADIRRLMGNPEPHTPEKPQRRSLEGMTVSVATRALRDAGLSSQPSAPSSPSSDAASSSSSATSAATDNTLSLQVRLALDALVEADTDGEGYDLVFRRRHKVVDIDGKVSSSLRPVTAVNLPANALLTLYDTLKPIIETIRPAPAEPVQMMIGDERPASMIPKRQRQSYAGVEPRGVDTILPLATKVVEGRQLAFDVTGTKAGSGYNKFLSNFYRANDLRELPSHFRYYLGRIGANIDAIRVWVDHQPKLAMAEVTPRELFVMWERSQKEPSTAQVTAPPPTLVKQHRCQADGCNEAIPESRVKRNAKYHSPEYQQREERRRATQRTSAATEKLGAAA